MALHRRVDEDVQVFSFILVFFKQLLCWLFTVPGICARLMHLNFFCEYRWVIETNDAPWTIITASVFWIRCSIDLSNLQYIANCQNLVNFNIFLFSVAIKFYLYFWRWKKYNFFYNTVFKVYNWLRSVISFI